MPPYAGVGGNPARLLRQYNHTLQHRGQIIMPT